MMPLKYSNFPVAPCFIHYFFGASSCYYSTTVQQGSGEVNLSFLLAFLTSSVMAQVVKCVSNFLIICHWIYSLYMIGSNIILFVLSARRSLALLGLSVLCFRKSGIVMCSCHVFPWSKHLITCVLANFKCSVSVCCNCNLIYRHSYTKHVVTILFLSLA